MRRAAKTVAILAALLAHFARPAAALPDEDRWADFERAARALGLSLPDAAAAALDEIDPAAVQRLWEDLQMALREGSLEDLARLQPWVRALLAEAKTRPRFAPYAAWLEPRLEYFDEALRVLRALTEPPPPATAPARPPPPPRPRPDDPSIWRRRAARHPRPPRAESMIPALQRVFRRHGVPEALVWLAEVESSLNPAARSPVGAVGLFQLMPATARQLGLKPEAVPDERLDPLKNADAAARYLRYLHRRFKSWPLALAAYNAGEGRVGRLLRETRATGFEAIRDRLPLETRMYVPRVLETVRLREGVNPAALPPPSGAGEGRAMRGTQGTQGAWMEAGTSPIRLLRPLRPLQPAATPEAGLARPPSRGESPHTGATRKIRISQTMWLTTLAASERQRAYIAPQKSPQIAAAAIRSGLPEAACTAAYTAAAAGTPRSAPQRSMPIRCSEARQKHSSAGAISSANNAAMRAVEAPALIA